MTGIDIAVSFDTTGSMYPCLTQVRRKVQDLTKRLFKDLPDLRMAIIAHGDYCDAGHPYVTSILDFVDKPERVCDFVRKVQSTGGGDSPECYELVLQQARSLTWKGDRARAMVMIGDATPHPVGYRYGGKTYDLDWRNELDLLHKDLSVHMYAVQCLRSRHYAAANKFWEGLADRGNGYHLELDQFATMPDLLMAIGYQQQGNAELERFEQQLRDQGRVDRNVDDLFARLLKRKRPAVAVAKRAHFAEVDPARFQVLHVDADCTIRDFVEDNGLRFQTGRGFYEFTKTVTVQERKEVILRENSSGDLYTGAKARDMLGLPFGKRGRVNPRTVPSLTGFTAFIQSTSWNRKLLGGTQFLYEVEDWAERLAA